MIDRYRARALYRENIDKEHLLLGESWKGHMKYCRSIGHAKMKLVKALKMLRNILFINLCWKSTMACAIFGWEGHFSHTDAFFNKIELCTNQ